MIVYLVLSQLNAVEYEKLQKGTVFGECLGSSTEKALLCL
jgi:hypothetical protein